MMNNDATLRDYYISIQKLYSNAVNMLTAINQSLTTSAATVDITVTGTNNTESRLRIPSFLYLESKLEELSNGMEAIFNIPNDGEAWFTKDGDSYKLNLVRSNIAPISPVINTTNLVGSISQSNILKDMVMPKTFLKMDISNLPQTVSKMFMRKIVINENNYALFDYIRSMTDETGCIPYDDCVTALYNSVKGVDYEEYDSVIDLPIRQDFYKSEFRIESVGNSYNDPMDGKLVTEVVINTLNYYNEEDSSISYTLKVGDRICLGNSSAVFVVRSISGNKTIEVKEDVGHAFIQTFVENNDMVFKIYVSDYSKYNYVEVPLEENQYIVVFLGTIWNNVRSILSSGLPIDLGNINMVDEHGTPILNSLGNQYDYVSYYKEYCTNLGDLLYGMSKCAYSQITHYTVSELNEMLNSEVAKLAVTQSISNDILKVVAINKHITDDNSVTDIVNLHNQKNSINAQLQTCQSNIDQVYSTMLTTDFSQNVTVTQKSLQEKLQGYYSERITLQKQLTSIIDNINSKADTQGITKSKTKYRIRGISDTSFIDSFASRYLNLNVIGIDIEYKYKTTSKDTSTLTTINGSTFTDWNKHITFDKDRVLEFSSNGYGIKYVDYNDIANSIKWNQFDIPIQYGEDVLIRVRYKYSVGQPFMNLYSPWSDELLVTFPTEFTENIEVSSILDTNSKDTISAEFNKTLINDGYAEHVQNKVLSNQQTFYHMPENIYSGFNTADNNLISLKDKLTEIVNNIEKYKDYIDGLTNTSYEIYLAYDDSNILLSPNSINKINIYNTEHISDVFIKKEMNLVIKNTGSSKLSLYSIFPGNTDVHLITSANNNFLNKADYERVPVFIGDKLDGQHLGQFIYFRSTNPYTNADIYFNDIAQNAYDFQSAITDGTNSTSYHYDFTTTLNKDNNQLLLAFRNNNYHSAFNYNIISEDTNILDVIEQYSGSTKIDNEIIRKLSNFEFYKYSDYNVISKDNVQKDKYYNQYILRYEDFILSNSGNALSLTDKTSLAEVVANKNCLYKSTQVTGSSTNTYVKSTESFIGAFLFPNLLSVSQIVSTEPNNVKSIEVGGSLSIPIIFEYYTEASIPRVTKSLYFDIKTNTLNEPAHYMIEVTGNYDFTTTGEIFKDVDKTIIM